MVLGWFCDLRLGNSFSALLKSCRLMFNAVIISIETIEKKWMLVCNVLLWSSQVKHQNPSRVNHWDRFSISWCKTLMIGQNCSQIIRARPGFEPGTSRTRSANHTPRPTSHLCWLDPNRTGLFLDYKINVGWFILGLQFSLASNKSSIV